jgi:hypothetical protein
MFKWFNRSEDESSKEKNNNELVEINAKSILDNLLEKNDENLLPDFNSDSNFKDSELFVDSGSDKYFKPIEKIQAGQNSFFNFLKSASDSKCSTPTQGQGHSGSGNLLSLLNSGSATPGMSPVTKPHNTGQVHSVEELEARLRQNNLGSNSNEGNKNENEQKILQNFFQFQLLPNLQQQQAQQQQQQQQKPHNTNQEDVNAFKKLLSQIAGDTEVHKSPGLGLGHQQMAGGPPAQQNQQTQNILAQLMNKSNYQNSQTNPGVQDMMHQLQNQQKFPQQQQQNHPGMSRMMNPIGQHLVTNQRLGVNAGEMLGKFGGPMKSPGSGGAPPGFDGKHTEILKRPDTQMLLQGELF